MKNNNVVPFVFGDNPVRVVIQDEQPWFVLKDVCAILSLTNSRMSYLRLDDDEKGVSNIYTLGGEQEIHTVNEFGLYSLILTSRKPEAKQFKRWITHEVLPDIRKTGQYKINDIKNNIHSLVILQRQSSALIKEISKEKNQEVIHFLYAQLEQIANKLEITPPSLDSFISVRSHIVQAFWDTYTTLRNRGIDCDHANKSSIIAINLNEFYALAKDNDLSPPNKTDLIPALKEDPQFIKVAAVASRQTRHTIKCWIFKAID